MSISLDREGVDWHTLRNTCRMADVSDTGKGETSCAVCMDRLTDARYLKCFHSFCTRCLGHCLRNQQVSCPLCREVTEVPRGVASLLPNLGATKRAREARMRERIETKIQDGDCQCGSCKELGSVCLAKSYCVDCQLLICDTCVHAHKLLKMTRSHRILDVLEFQNNSSGLADGKELTKESGGSGICEAKCEKHGASFTLFCRPCEEPVCPQCAARDHDSELDDHDCVSLSDVGDEVSEELRQLISKIDPNYFDRIADSYKRRLKELADKAQELKAKINEAAQNEVACLYAKIEARRGELHARVLDIEKASGRKVAHVLSGVRRLRSRAEKLDGYAEELLKTGSIADIVAVRDTLTDHLKETRAEMRKLTSDDTDIDDLAGYSFTATDWMAADYEPGVGRLESRDMSSEDRGGSKQTCRFKRGLSARVLRTPQRPHSSLPRIDRSRSLVH